MPYPRTIPGTFRQSATGVTAGDGNLFDPPIAGGVSTWTQGATLLDSPDYGTSIPRGFSLISVSFSAQLTFVDTGNPGGKFGKLGKVIAGLYPDRDATLGVGFSRIGAGVGVQWFQKPVLPLPAETSYLVTLWDEDTNPVPPVDPAWVAVGGAIQLPIPLSLDEQQPTVGLWLMPSLIGYHGSVHIPTRDGLTIRNARYLLTHEGL